MATMAPIDKEIKEKVIEHVGNNKLKYRSLAHFVSIACNEKIEEDNKTGGNNSEEIDDDCR